MLNPYNLEQDEQGYYFTTENNRVYRIIFDNLDSVFTDYPTLQGRVFSYSFYPKDQIERPKVDLRIRDTIVFSILNFFSTNTNLIVFVCDSSDKREVCRKKLFDKWFTSFNSEELLEKYDGKVESDVEEYAITNSIIMRADLSDKKQVIKTFKELNNQFSESK